MKRREFLRFAVSTVALQVLPAPGVASGWLPDFSSISLQKTGMNAAQWQEIAAVQNHLLPSEKAAPGAQDINATKYLQWVLSDPKLEAKEREFFAQGVSRLQKLLKPGELFSALGSETRESVLRQLEQNSQGRIWITELLHYLFEALLTDPVYGGNPDGIGWKWLGHQPGFRRPDKDTRYFLL